MAITCTPNNLAELAKCFACLSDEQRENIKVYLLRSIAGLSAQTPDQLAESAKCFACIPSDKLQEISAYLLCRILNT